MSYFDQASLVMIPSGYKTSKVYSVKPTDGSGDMSFSRSNDTATRVNSAGLIEKVRTNLITYSNDFSNAAYSKITDGTYTITSETITDPFGNSVAVQKVTLTSGGYLVLRNSLATATTSPTTGSVYIKKTVAGSSISIDLSDASTATAANNTNWQRLVSINPASVYGSGTFIDINITSVNEPVYLAYAQIEVSDFGATDYIATTSAAVSVGPVANVPRLDYLNSSCPRLLLEPQRTNLFQYSEQLDNAYWSKIGAITVTANNAVSPDGYQNADLVTGAGGGARIQRAFSGLTAGTRTLSCFVKAGTGSDVTINSYDGIVDKSAIFNVVTGVVDSTSAGVSATITNYGNGWYRLTHTYTSAGTSYSCQFFFNDGLTYRVWGMQFEDSASYATSYIPTLGSASTRGSDTASKTGISSLIGQTEGTIFLEFQKNAGVDAANIAFSLSDGTSANLIYYNFEGPVIEFIASSSVQAIKSGGINLVAGTNKIAVYYKANDFGIYLNGTSIFTDTSGSVGAMSKFNLGSFFNDAYPVGTPINQALVFKTRLTNAQLAELTTL